MARKRKKSSNLGWLAFVILGLGVATFVMMFFDAITLKMYFPPVTLKYTGLQIAFGYKDIYKFNILAVLMYIVPLLAGIFVLIASKGIKKIVCLVSGLLFAGSGFLLIFVRDIVDNISVYNLTAFTIIGIIAAFLAAIGSFVLALEG